MRIFAGEEGGDRLIGRRRGREKRKGGCGDGGDCDWWGES